MEARWTEERGLLDELLALQGRPVTIPRDPLSDELLGSIVVLPLNRSKKRVEAQPIQQR